MSKTNYLLVGGVVGLLGFGGVISYINSNNGIRNNLSQITQNSKAISTNNLAITQNTASSSRNMNKIYSLEGRLDMETFRFSADAVQCNGKLIEEGDYVLRTSSSNPQVVKAEYQDFISDCKDKTDGKLHYRTENGTPEIIRGLEDIDVIDAALRDTLPTNISVSKKGVPTATTKSEPTQSKIMYISQICPSNQANTPSCPKEKEQVASNVNDLPTESLSHLLVRTAYKTQCEEELDGFDTVYDSKRRDRKNYVIPHNHSGLEKVLDCLEETYEDTPIKVRYGSGVEDINHWPNKFDREDILGDLEKGYNVEIVQGGSSKPKKQTRAPVVRQVSQPATTKIPTSDSKKKMGCYQEDTKFVNGVPISSNKCN